MLPFQDLPFALNLLIFTSAAVAIWLAGTRLSRYAEEIASRTGVGRALIGALLLGGITSLPEAATTTAASAIGNVPLAVNNIFGGVAMQVAILGLADLIVPGRALSARIRQPAVLLQGVLLIGVLTLAAAGIVVGDVLVLGVGLWAAAVLAASLLSFLLVHRFGSEEAWEPSRPAIEDGEAGSHLRKEQNPARTHSRAHLIISTGTAAVVILLGGFVLAMSGEAIAEQSGLGASFVGVLFLAVATSLPEISTTLAAVRMGQYTMAYSNIFGANILDTAVLFLADVAYPGGPVLNEVGRFSLFGALLGVATTAVCLTGLLLRRRRVVLGGGVDALAVLAVYGAGIVLLYFLR